MLQHSQLLKTYSQLLERSTANMSVVVVRPQRQSSEELSDLYLPSPAGPTTSNRSKGTGSTTLYEMIEAGVLQPGVENATVTYKGTTYTASLQSNGTILFRGEGWRCPPCSVAWLGMCVDSLFAMHQSISSVSLLHRQSSIGLCTKLS